MSDGFILDRKVTVCGRCLQASCWQGTFMCWESENAGTVEKTVGELRYLNLESPDYWFRDPSTGNSDEDAVREVYCFDRIAIHDYMEAHRDAMSAAGQPESASSAGEHDATVPR